MGQQARTDGCTFHAWTRATLRRGMREAMVQSQGSREDADMRADIDQQLVRDLAGANGDTRDKFAKCQRRLKTDPLLFEIVGVNLTHPLM